MQSFSRKDKQREAQKAGWLGHLSLCKYSNFSDGAGGGRRESCTWHCLSNSRQEGLGPASGTPIFPRSRVVCIKDKKPGPRLSPGDTVVRAVGSRPDVHVLLRRLTVASESLASTLVLCVELSLFFSHFVVCFHFNFNFRIDKINLKPKPCLKNKKHTQKSQPPVLPSTLILAPLSTILIGF